MREPKKIPVPWGTGWCAPEKGQPEDGVWQGRIYDIEWKIKDGVPEIEHARIAFRKIKTVKFLRQFTVTVSEVDNIFVCPHRSDNRFLTMHIQECIASQMLDKHGTHIESDFIEWVLEPAIAMLIDFRSELGEKCRIRSDYLKQVI